MKKTILATLIALISTHAHALNETTPAPANQAITSQPAKEVTNESSKNETDKTAQSIKKSEEKSGVLIQVGAFTNADLADMQAAKVALLGVPTRIMKVTNSQGKSVRLVRSRHRIKQAEAEKMVNNLRNNDVQALLLD